jgi:glycosyltransferase involved in cell wall biosynthesis
MRNLRTEDEIIASWDSDIDKPVVSISCITYNHESYIEDALEGFLMQETSISFEILIHDDASTDKTTEIIKEYEECYPRLIKPIYQKENQFSKGVVVNSVNLRKAKGEYIAMCHGDDYWTDSNKLQKQLELMVAHKVGISGHPVSEIDQEGNFLNRVTGYQVKEVAHLDSVALIRKKGNMLPFGSIMIDEKAKKDLVDHMPPVLFHTGVQLLGAMRNGLLILPDVMGVYRTGVPGSTTELMLKNSKQIAQITVRRVSSIKALRGLYSSDVSLELDRLLARQFVSSHSLKSSDYRDSVMKAILTGESFFRKIKLMFLIVMELLFYEKIKMLIKSIF